MTWFDDPEEQARHEAALLDRALAEGGRTAWQAQLVELIRGERMGQHQTTIRAVADHAGQVLGVDLVDMGLDEEDAEMLAELIIQEARNPDNAPAAGG